MSPRAGPLGRLSAFVWEWTPIIMLSSYICGSIFLYILFPPIVHEVIWYIFAGLQTLTSLSVSTEAMQSIRPSIKARREMRKAEKEGWEKEDLVWPHIDVVLVAYLPNEQEIIMRQVRYALTKIDYPHDKLTINVAYNTPRPIEPVETELRELETHHSNVRVISVPNSTSKADNINYFLTLPNCKGEIVTLYDTDHFAEPQALRWVAKRFMTGEVVSRTYWSC